MIVFAEQTQLQDNCLPTSMLPQTPPVYKLWMCLEKWLLIDFWIMDGIGMLLKAVDPLQEEKAQILHLTHTFMGLTLILKPGASKTKQNKKAQILVNGPNPL